MKKVKILLILTTFFCLLYGKIPGIYASGEQRFIYRFPLSHPLLNKVFINGYVSFGPQNAKQNKYKIKSRFILRVFNTGKTTNKNIYSLNISAIKSMFILNGYTLENTTASDTEVSGIIPEMKIEMNKSGKIISSREGFALFDFIPFIRLLPSFPEKIVEGQSWLQVIPSFNSPLGKMPALRFTYTYVGKQNGFDKFNLISSQFFNQEEKENNIKTKITGLNSSSGKILFDPEKGMIKAAKIKMNISADFITTPAKQKTGEKANPIPYNVLINISFLIQPVNM
ncbi:MAG: hypothetical protein M1409_08765 [Actinobacteria bacterium]|nr:hypothetical protein [Actinomycetota bacterium]MCL5674964.1 hypothetical protein [Candidatus Omnitrophota bacterium]